MTAKKKYPNRMLSISLRKSDEDMWEWAKKHAKTKRISLSALIANLIHELKGEEESKDGNS